MCESPLSNHSRGPVTRCTVLRDNIDARTRTHAHALQGSAADETGGRGTHTLDREWAASTTDEARLLEALTGVFDAPYQVPASIIVPGVSLGAVMHLDELRAQQTPTFFPNWNDHPPPQYFLEDLPVQNGFADDSSSKRHNVQTMHTPWEQQRRISTADLLPLTTASALAQKPAAVSKSPPPKAKRVRTGCLTCRDRHLKCDEAVPDCLNCRKRGRDCVRGVRLNFLDVNVHSLDCVPDSEDWAVQFHDESRDIASEYRGGLRSYAPYDSEPEIPGCFDNDRNGHKERRYSKPGGQSILHNQSDAKASRTQSEYGLQSSPTVDYWGNEQNTATLGDRGSHSRTTSGASKIVTPLSSSQSNTPYGAPPLQQLVTGRTKPSPRRRSDVSAATSMLPQATIATRNEAKFAVNVSQEPPLQPLPNAAQPPPEREFLNAPEEIAYMQVFVEDVWVWMDSFDQEKHFSRLIPFYALKSTMLLNAFLACGVKHLALSSPNKNDKALFYYNTATSQLLRSLQNPDRNMAECAITAVILNVYEVMSEKPAHRMRHIGGARALILECRWDASSTGIGAACFWQNVTMEVLICLSEKWQTTWDPDDWGLDLGFFREGEDYMAIEPDEVFVHRILMIKSAATLGRLFYHTAQCILTQSHPTEQVRHSEGMRALQIHHVHHVCGIVACTKDRGVIPMAIRCLIIVSAVLTDVHEQAEVLGILERIRHHEGWHLGSVEQDLKRTWGWDRSRPAASSLKSQTSDQLETGNHTMPPPFHAPEMAPIANPATLLTGTMRVLTPPGVAKAPLNPLSFADFSLPNHPYRNWYEPASTTSPGSD
ncbi:hypothetical protein G7Z17_g11905 [Cylindrodendrum hubeiense]|uniref:Zn(2)-C6 fungal-type domain-containing protein n=1 Tax=Cylindrodendrum hubeiense TaxID=595255 RepID=A0A9P5GZX5_9HYPO|nr:hypothetical protein G7Z17_g11905 [Cylindrodendrum hubeiense]